MTCIVGMISDEFDEKTEEEVTRVYIGADSCGSNGSDFTLRKDPKVFINGEFLIGYTSSFRMGQLLMYCSLPVIKKKELGDLFKFMVKRFVPAIREILKEGGYSKISSNTEAGGTFLVGVHGRLFTIQGDFQVSETYDNFAACGCGIYCAKASMMTTQSLSKSDSFKVEPNTEDILTLAMESAANVMEGVRAPYTILKI